MGSFTSKDFVEMIEEEVPNTPISSKRLIEFDPRSPTAGIARTPIQVEKTPEKLDDPRSPTIGIMRTPIVNGDESTNSVETCNSSLDISSGGSNCSLSDITPLSLQAALDSLPPLDPDYEEEGDLMLDTPTSYSVEVKSQESVSTPKLVMNSRTKSASFQVHSDVKDSQMSSPLRMIPDGVQRSPLGKRNIDMSSPRHIVQRKQANKLGMLKTKIHTSIQKPTIGSPCRVEVLSSEDKENMSM